MPKICLRTRVKLVEMKGRGAVFIAKCHAAWCCVPQHHAAWHMAFLSATCHDRLTSLSPKLCTVFYLLFLGNFWGPSGVQNGSCMIPLEILRSILSKDIKFAQIRALLEKLWLPEARVSSCFSAFFRRRFRPNQRCYQRTESCTS